MELVNITPSVAEIVVSDIAPDWPRIGVLAAKTTYRFDAEGRTEVDTDEPFPIFTKDESTELGLLPRDDLPSFDELFEVILLGAAYSAPVEAVTERIVSLAVGEVRRELRVVGDRHWVSQAQHSVPEPFARMPLTYAQAFGGTSEVLIDHESPVLISDHRNPIGRGFDPSPAVQAISENIGCPAGFPQFSGTRTLPNLEHVQVPVRSWQDAPDPYCWATMPLESAMHAQRMVLFPADTKSPDDMELLPSWTHRAHPEWVIPRPPAGVPVTLDGFVPEGLVSFALPDDALVADYVAGSRQGSIPLELARLVLLPEERRFYVVQQARFNMSVTEGDERSMRIRRVRD